MNMTIALTGPVSAFFEAERTQDVEALARKIASLEIG
jgi:hypothetical protein